MQNNETYEPGDDIEHATDDEIRHLVRTYGINSPWWGSSDERTLRDEIHRRMPKLEAFWQAEGIALMADIQAGGFAALMDVLRPPSPAVAALRKTYDTALEMWLKRSGSAATEDRP